MLQGSFVEEAVDEVRGEGVVGDKKVLDGIGGSVVEDCKKLEEDVDESLVADEVM